ncbi:cytochrome C biogenesis protein [Corynebacterium ammoniagenes]|nr:cytochrome C biogenesis protein [Corynebacterium ammoniagenes]
MSPKQKIALCAFLISLGFAMMCGVTLMATQVALGTFLFAFALMLAPLAAIFMLLVSWYMNVGTISRALFGLSGTLVMASMAFAIFTPFGTLPGISIPVFMAGTAVGVGAVLLVSPYARLEGPFKVLQPKSGSSAELSNTSHLVGSR